MLRHLRPRHRRSNHRDELDTRRQYLSGRLAWLSVKVSRGWWRHTERTPVCKYYRHRLLVSQLLETGALRLHLGFGGAGRPKDSSLWCFSPSKINVAYRVETKVRLLLDC